VGWVLVSGGGGAARAPPAAFGMHQQGIDRALQGSGIYRAVKIILYFFAVFL